MKKTLLGIALSVAMLPVMSFAQTAPSGAQDQSSTTTQTTKKTKTKHARKAKHSKKAGAAESATPAK